MKDLKRNRLGLGGIGTLVLIVLVLLLAFVGGGVAQPYLMQQDISPGDVLEYEVTVSDGSTTETFTWKFEFVSMNKTSAEIDFTDEDGLVTNHTVEWEHDGKMFVVTSGAQLGTPLWMMQFVQDNPDDFDKSTGFGMTGVTPMLMDEYTGDFIGGDLVINAKKGTMIPVMVELESGTTAFSMTLKDTSISWVSLPMTLV